MLRAAAKNHAAVTVVVDAVRLRTVLERLRDNGGMVSPPPRFELAVKVSSIPPTTTAPSPTILGSIRAEGSATCSAQLHHPVRQGSGHALRREPHQQAAFYVEPPAEACIATAPAIRAKELSFNNVADTDAALECVKSFAAQPA